MFTAFIRAKRELVDFEFVLRDTSVRAFDFPLEYFNKMDLQLVHKQLTTHLIGKQYLYLSFLFDN